MKVSPNFKLKLALITQGKTQRDLAFGTEINESTMSKIVRGYETPTPQVKQKIAAFLGRSSEELFGD